jgi:fructokinase
MALLAGIEAGGTKFVCAVGDATDPRNILDSATFPTEAPDKTIGNCVAFFSKHRAEIAALGVASFGPVDVHRHSPTFGFVTNTPKPGWAHTDLGGAVARALGGVPFGFDTDVNGAALGEHRWGAGVGLSDLVYFTIGTGIGGGAIVNNALVHGLVHTEMGHIRIPRHADDAFAGWCPYHGDCFEGLAAGPALERRWGAKAETFGPEHPAWDLEAYYIAQALHTVVCLYSPQRIILGGGVSSQPQLLPMVRAKLLASLNNYVGAPELLERVDTYVVNPGLGNRAGVLGAMALAMDALTAAQRETF